MTTQLKSLRMNTVTVHEVNYADLDDFISFHYGVAFETPCDQEMSNDSDKVLTISKEKLDKWDMGCFDKAKIDGCFPGGSLRPIMTDLCNRGLLPAGKYVIRVSW